MNQVKVFEEESVSTLRRLLKTFEEMRELEKQVLVYAAMNPAMDIREIAKQGGRVEVMQQLCKQIQNVLNFKTGKPGME